MTKTIDKVIHKFDPPVTGVDEALQAVVQVALDLPLDRLFDYWNRGAGRADIGRRVAVPFGRSSATGIIVGLDGASEVADAQLKPIGMVDRSIEPIAPDVIATLRFASSYYQHPFGAALFAALPPAASAAGSARPARPEGWRLTDAGRLRQHAPGTRPAPAQQRLLDLLATQAVLPDTQLATCGPRETSTRAMLRQLLQHGWVEGVPAGGAPAGGVPAESMLAEGVPVEGMLAEGVLVEASVRAPPPGQSRRPSPSSRFALTEAQAAAIATLEGALDQFGVHLLFGVTGSGKTTVYARCMRQCLAGGGQALMLVPEINLTPQLESALSAELPGARIVVLHSGLPVAERRRRWQAAATGQADVVVGTRLAVFTSMPRLGLIVVDEEHDGSFKQEEGLRYHARDISVWRARARQVPVVLGSATPVLETLHNAQSGRYRLLQLAARPTGPMPSIELIDLRRYPKNAAHNPGMSEPLLNALCAQLERGEQSLVLVNRRGYAPVVRCNSCAWVAGCPRCSARLVLHQRQRGLRCHHCGLFERPPQHCPTCGNPDLTPLGLGTERLEETLARLLPGARMLRIDRDSMRTPAAWAHAREQIQRGEVDLLVGTQMLAKGHDFPRLTLVGVVDTDQTLYSSDFRAPERLFALLTQVAGRAGRADLAGRVLIETAVPQHPLFSALTRHDYTAFASQLLDERRRLGLPPFSHQAILRADALALADALAFLAEAARQATAIDASITLYDPVPALLVRRAGRERAQLLVQSRSRGRFQRFLSIWRARIAAQRAPRVHWILDVDPLEL